MRRTRPLLASMTLLSACLTLDSFLFIDVPVDEYRWDDDPCDPLLAGELAEAEVRLHDGPAAGCHPSRIPADARTEAFVALPDGRRMHYVFAHREGAPATIFYSHGTGRHIGRYWDRVELMWSWGYNVMIYDYPGYGRSEGEPDEAGVYAAATAVLEQALPRMPGVDLQRVYLMGYSLGATATLELALRASEGELSVQPRGVITEAAFCSVEALLQDGSRLDLPGHFFSTLEFDNCSKIARLDPELPVLLMHGTNDTFVVPLHARMLDDAAVGEDVTLAWIEGADHGELPVADADGYRDTLEGFIDDHLPVP